MRERVTEHRILQAPLVVRRREGEKGRLAAGELVDRRRRHGYPTLCSATICQKRPVRLRVAAVRALASANTPAAKRALRTLVGDRESEVRAMALDGLAGRLG